MMLHRISGHCPADYDQHQHNGDPRKERFWHGNVAKQPKPHSDQYADSDVYQKMADKGCQQPAQTMQHLVWQVPEGRFLQWIGHIFFLVKQCLHAAGFTKLPGGC